jgi:hypothetical protein
MSVWISQFILEDVGILDPIDDKSITVKHSSLLSDTLKELDHMTETLDKLVSNREDNRKALQKKKTSMIKQIRVMRR